MCVSCRSLLCSFFLPTNLYLIRINTDKHFVLIAPWEFFAFSCSVCLLAATGTESVMRLRRHHRTFPSRKIVARTDPREGSIFAPELLVFINFNFNSSNSARERCSGEALFVVWGAAREACRRAAPEKTQWCSKVHKRCHAAFIFSSLCLQWAWEGRDRQRQQQQ